ncbi:7204_t:CDS:2, partial [Entrophospora sp. SA101]
ISSEQWNNLIQLCKKSKMHKGPTSEKYSTRWLENYFNEDGTYQLCQVKAVIWSTNLTFPIFSKIENRFA